MGTADLPAGFTGQCPVQGFFKLLVFGEAGIIQFQGIFRFPLPPEAQVEDLAHYPQS